MHQTTVNRGAYLQTRLKHSEILMPIQAVDIIDRKPLFKVH